MQFLTAFIFVILALCSGCQKNYDPECDPCPDAVEKTYIHKYGVEVAKNDWAFRGKEGKVVSRLKTGVTASKNYRNGILDGETVYTFPHSNNTERVEIYENGTLVKEVENYTSESPKSEITYSPHGRTTIQTWYENGTPRSSEEYESNKLITANCYNMNNQVEACINNGDGERVNRDGFGQLDSKDVFAAGNLDTRMTYYPNGASKEIIPYKNGKICGFKKTFNPGGEPCTMEEWENDQQNGITHMYQNGEKFAEVPYVAGIKNGIEQRFRDGKYLVEEISWKNGFKHGPSYTYVGHERSVDWYYQGENVSKAKYEQLKRTGAVIK